MANTIPLAFGFGMIGLLLGAVLGAVESREKFAFVAGVILLVGGSALVGTRALSATLGGLLALVGFLSIVASTIPLLRQSPTTA